MTIDLTFIGYTAGVFGLIAVLASAFVVYRSTITKTTISEQKGLIEILTHSRNESDKKVGRLEIESVSLSKSLHTMQGQIDLLKDIPLATIDLSLKELAKLNKEQADSNYQILQTLKKTAKIDAEDRDVLTNQNKHIRDEVKKITKE